LLNLSEEERAAESIARILMYGGGSEPEKTETEIGAVPTGGETPADETVPETPTEETPPTEEEPPAETLPV
jgi:hypothetical protein